MLMIYRSAITLSVLLAISYTLSVAEAADAIAPLASENRLAEQQRSHNYLSSAKRQLELARRNYTVAQEYSTKLQTANHSLKAHLRRALGKVFALNTFAQAIAHWTELRKQGGDAARVSMIGLHVPLEAASYNNMATDAVRSSEEASGNMINIKDQASGFAETAGIFYQAIGGCQALCQTLGEDAEAFTADPHNFGLGDEDIIELNTVFEEAAALAADAKTLDQQTTEQVNIRWH